MTASLFTHPLDVIRSRIAFQVSGERIYLGIHHVVKMISRTEGVLAFYKGFIPATMAMIPTIGKFVMSAIMIFHVYTNIAIIMLMCHL